jgi:hypothetical protein
LVLTLTASVPAAADDTPVSIEYQVKAAFLLNFTRFVEWPDGAIEDTAPFAVCTLVRNPFDRVLEETLRGESWNGHAFELRTANDAAEAARCHLLFVPRAEAARFVGLVDRLAGTAVLTIGESPEFLDRAGIVNFVLEKNRVRFDIDAAAADRAGLRVSSRLLRLAQTVRNAPGAR